MDGIVTVTTTDDIVAAIAKNQIFLTNRRNLAITTAIAQNRIIAFATIKDIRVKLPKYPVIAFATVGNILAFTANYGVITLITIEVVITATAKK